ncbi:MAG: hypothetical protein M0Q37_10585, partial [Sphaerochaeta sp.]|nr:hypothetical protein [Sphaerochaeta sp.]
DASCYGRPMSITAIIQYILLLLLVAFTIFNIYNFTAGRKRRAAAKAQYERTLALLEQDAMAVVKKEKVTFATKMGYINDQNQGILLAFDKDHELVGVFLSGEYHLIRADHFVSATQRYETHDDKKISNVVVDVETSDTILTVTFGARTYRPSSYLGKFILSESQEFANYIIGHLRPSAQ